MGQAIPAVEQALTIARTSGDRRHEGTAFSILGTAYRQLGDPRRALMCYEHYLASTRACENRAGEGIALSNMGCAYVELGQAQQALAALEQGLTVMREIGDRWREAEDQRALPLLRAAVAYEQEIGYAQVTAHAALLARLEAGEALPEKVQHVRAHRTALEQARGETSSE